MSRTNRILYFFISLTFFILLDLYLTNYILNFGYNLAENPVFDLIFIKNEGAAFNILQNSKIFLIIFAVTALFIISAYTIKNITKISLLTTMYTSLLCSGIFCNLYERVIFGHVRDFIKLNFIDFPVFNISDIFINISVFAIIIIIVKSSYFKK